MWGSSFNIARRLSRTVTLANVVLFRVSKVNQNTETVPPRSGFQATTGAKQIAMEKEGAHATELEEWPFIVLKIAKMLG